MSYIYDGDIKLHGSNADKIFKRLIPGNDSAKIYQNIVKNSVLITKESRVWVPAHDTTFYEIKY